MFNIIARRTLNEYCESYPEARTAFQKWYHELVSAEFKSFNELKKTYTNASLVADDRVVFNICGNKFRLVVRINFQFKAIQFKWFGSHTDYDKINIAAITYKKEKTMKIKILKTEREYDVALNYIDTIFNAKLNTPKGEELGLLLLVIKDYEDKHHPVTIPDAIEAVKMYMHEHGLKNKDLEPIIGSKSYVSQILNRQKPLTAEMMRALHQRLGIPANILLAA